MKSIGKLTGLVLITTILFSCSAVKVTDSWKDTTIKNIKDKKIMVVSKTNNDVIRARFEKDVATNLNEKGYQSVESHVLFPKILSDSNECVEEPNKVKQEIKKSGIEVVVMTVLRDTQEYTETTTTGSTYYVNTLPMYYGRGYYRSFYGYYGNVYIYTDPVTTVTTTNKKYILETVVYDLTLPEEKQLIGVITTSIDNPQTLEKTSEHYAKKVVKQIGM